MKKNDQFSNSNFQKRFGSKIKLGPNCKLKIVNCEFVFGYTLVEILVAVTIIGILFGVGYASFRSFSQRQIVLSAAKNVQGDLRLTQQLALAGQKPIDSHCDSPLNSLNGYNFTILSTSSYEIRASCTGGTVSDAYKTVALDSGVLFATPLPSPNPILFKVLGNGNNLSDGGNVEIKLVQEGSLNQSSVTVSSGGQIQ